MTIGERIKSARKEAGLTQAQLAKKTGMATITIRQYELGKRQPRLEQLQHIAKALKISILYFVGNPPMCPTVESAASEYKKEITSNAIANAVDVILETIYEGKHEQIVEGKYLSVPITVYGNGEKSIVLGDDDYWTIITTLESVARSLCENLGQPTHIAIEEIKQDLSSEKTKQFLDESSQKTADEA